MKDSRDLKQIYRVDGKCCFVEVTGEGLPLDKVQVRFVQYNVKAEKGNRMGSSIDFFINPFTAGVLHHDIMSGRLAALAKKELAKTKAEGRKYANSIWMKQGGTSAKRSATNTPIAKTLEITPGSAQPWILVAKQGPGHETPQGLIVMDKAETTIRVPMSTDFFKEFALALDTTKRLWEQLRYVPVLSEGMRMAEDRRREAIEKAKAENARTN